MPPKKDQYASPARKILGLFGLLMFSGKKYSLMRLARVMNCSKQTILRMMEQIELSHEAKVETWIEDGERWYRLAAPARPLVSLTPEQIQQLVLCRDMVWKLLPEALRREIHGTLSKTAVLLPDMSKREAALQSLTRARGKGSIDYDPHQENIRELLAAISKKRVCDIEYQAGSSPEFKAHVFAPVRLLAYREALYVEGMQLRQADGSEQARPMVLAVHRIKSLTPTRRRHDFACSEEGDSDRFGFMNGEPFRVKVKFCPEVAHYIRERRWSEDQAIREQKNGKLVLEFTAQSKPEVVSWILSFGSLAEVIRPKDVRDQVKDEVKKLMSAYAG